MSDTLHPVPATPVEFQPMSEEQRARWRQTGLFPMERWGSHGEHTPLVCPMPTNEELRALAEAVPDRLQLSGWYCGKPAFGSVYVYADNFRGMGRQAIFSFPQGRNYFGGLGEYTAAVHPRTVLRLLDRIATLEGQLAAAGGNA